MSYEYCTIVKASSNGFWKKLPANQINGNSFYIITNIGNDEIKIYSRNHTPIDYIFNLSKEYPDEIFLVKIYGDDFYDNIVYIYKFSNGTSRLIKDGYEYCFFISIADRDKLPIGFYAQFQKKVAEDFQKLNYGSLDDICLELSIDEEQSVNYIKAEKISASITYKTKDFYITTKKGGKTLIRVDVDFFNKPKDKNPKN